MLEAVPVQRRREDLGQELAGADDDQLGLEGLAGQVRPSWFYHAEKLLNNMLKAAN